MPAFILVSILVVEAAELPGQGIDLGVLFVSAGGHKIRCCDDCGVDVRAAPELLPPLLSLSLLLLLLLGLGQAAALTTDP